MGEHPTAAIIIIGDEILRGDTRDSNSYFLCRKLYEIGVQVQRITVIPDEVNTIGEEVLHCSKKFTFVFTAGGIGPTHDDITYAGIAKAFGEKLIRNNELAMLLQHWCAVVGLNSDAVFKMSLIPQSAKLHCLKDLGTSENFAFPIVSMHNVFIFPGIPVYLEYSFDLLKDLFSAHAVNFHHCELYLRLSEFEIADVLTQAAEKFKDHLKFGSYPDILNKHYKVKICLESDSEKALEEAESYLRSILPPNCVASYLEPGSQESIDELYLLVNGNLTDNFYRMNHIVVKESINILEQCLHQYSLNNICISFNGGKDCTALLHLMKNVIYKNIVNPPLLKAVYIKGTDPFPEVEEFIQLSVERYQLQLITYASPIKSALYQLLDDYKDIKVVLMGTRQTDPNSSTLRPFQHTDVDWPPLMRVNPLLHWSYHDIWTFLKMMKIPYCSLYDKGYTSLGNKNNTRPNPQLQHTSEDGSIWFRPAYLLKDPSEEREGRS